MNLPPNPGLARRLAYGEQLRTRIRSRPYYSYYLPESQRTRYDIVLTLPKRDGVYINDLQQTIVEIAKDEARDECCSICLDVFRTGHDIIRRLVCKHVYHIVCIDKWLCNSNTCPLCKDSIT